MKQRLLAALTITIGLVACGGIDGTLSVKQTISLKDRKGANYSVPAGSYKVNLNYKENKNRLIIEFDKLNGKKTKIETNTPEGFDIPENGNFSLKAADYGQNMDLDGSVTTVRTQTPERWERESCQWTEYETWCQTNPQGQTQCYQRPITRYGWRDIRYYDETIVQTLKAAFSHDAGVVAEMNARSSSTFRRETYTGPCR